MSFFIDEIFLGIAAGGLLRLLLATRTYDACKGGATLLTTYAAVNQTVNNGVVYHAADSVRIWQVCVQWKALQ
jgi:hypothetical protein